jgi:hypothetical protein
LRIPLPPDWPLGPVSIFVPGQQIEKDQLPPISLNRRSKPLTAIDKGAAEVDDRLMRYRV